MFSTLIRSISDFWEFVRAGVSLGQASVLAARDRCQMEYSSIAVGVFFGFMVFMQRCDKLRGLGRIKSMQTIQMYANYLPSWLKNSRLAKLNGLHRLHFPMGRFAWVTVFAILCGTLALRPENSASLPAVLSGYVFLPECV